MEACCSCEEVQRMIEEVGERIIATCQATGRTKAKTKRRPSAYNLFIKSCTVGGKNSLKTCAAEYKALPDAQKEKFKLEAATL